MAIPTVDPVTAGVNVFSGGGKRNTNQDVTLDNLLAQMQDLKSRANQGQVSESDYSNQINSLVTQAFNFRNQFGSQGSQYADRVNPQWNKIVQEGFATSNGQPFTQLNPFKGTPYEGSETLKDMLQSYSSSGKGQAQGSKEISTYANTFKQMFNSSVGRDPTADEYDNFFKSIVQDDQPWSKPLDQTQLREQTSGLLSQFYAGEAQKTAEQKLKDQATAATAPGSAFDTWQQAYTKSLGDVENSLMDFQNRLFEKIRPNLITSLKSQGLLDSGALNEAFAGTAGDLTSSVQNYMAQARNQAAQDINNQRYQVQSQPYNYALSSSFGAVPNLTQSGQTALQNVYGNMVNTNLANMNYNNNLALLEKQNANQPSLLNQFGGLLVGGTAAGIGQQIGRGIV